MQIHSKKTRKRFKVFLVWSAITMVSTVINMFGQVFSDFRIDIAVMLLLPIIGTFVSGVIFAFSITEEK